MSLEEDYVEAILEWRERGPTPEVSEWLTEHGLETLPMRAGLLVMGARRGFESACGVDLSRAEPPVRLPVPERLREVVAAITIPPPRRIMGGGGSAGTEQGGGGSW